MSKKVSTKMGKCHITLKFTGFTDFPIEIITKPDRPLKPVLSHYAELINIPEDLLYFRYRNSALSREYTPQCYGIKDKDIIRVSYKDDIIERRISEMKYKKDDDSDSDQVQAQGQGQGQTDGRAQGLGYRFRPGYGNGQGQARGDCEL